MGFRDLIPSAVAARWRLILQLVAFRKSLVESCRMAKSLLRMNNPSSEFICLAVMMYLRLFRSSKNSDLTQRMSTMGSERAFAALTTNVRYADKAAVHG